MKHLTCGHKKGSRTSTRNCMISILFFIFTFYAFTALLAFLGYILWYILCTNATLSFVVTCKKRELLPLHIKSTDPDYCLHSRYESASHPIDNTWHTAPQSPTQDWNPLPDDTPAQDA